MIRCIKFNNFYSFRKDQEINFLANKKKTYDYFQSKSEQQITKIAGFIGGNASGKTNIMRLFSFLGYFVCKSSKDEDEAENHIAYSTFFNNDDISNFYIEYEDSNSIFFYEFSVQKNIILKETLSVLKMEKYSRQTEIFSRRPDDINLNSEYFKDFPVDFLKNIRSDISLVAFLKTHYNIEIINRVFNYFLKFRTNINERGQINTLAQQIKTIEMYLHDVNLKKEMENFIRHFDIGLSGFDIEKKDANEGISLSVRGIHDTKEKNNKLDFNYESRGTQSLFFVLAKILGAVKNGNVVIIDEIETGFHPEALNKLISYFVDEDRDRNIQMIFSSHSLGFINKLDMQQIFLVEKNEVSESSVCRLSQIGGIRPDENFLAKYMAGSYGAFPKIRV